MSTRREFIKQTAIISAMSWTASADIPLSANGTAFGQKWIMPDEGGRQQCAFIAFGAQKAIWREMTSAVQIVLGDITRAIATYQPVIIFCHEHDLQLAKEKCGDHNTTFIITELDDIWMRDIGANFVVNSKHELSAVDFNFNGWGGKQQHNKDAQLAYFQSKYFGINSPHISALVGEGGGIEVDGHGTGIMTESSWVNNNRNPNLTRAQIEKELKVALGLRKIIWLPGVKGKDITDAHVDFYARFVKPGVVIINLDNDPDSYDYQVTREHLAILKNTTDADGRKLQIHTISPPLNPRQNRFNKDNPDFATGYINYFVINGAIIAPEFGDTDADLKAHKLLKELYPDREIVTLNIDVIAAGGGGIHCVTHQLPAI